MIREDLIYSLTKKISTFEIRNKWPHLFCKFRQMPRVFEISVQNDDKLRENFRKALPTDLSPSLVMKTEHLVVEAGQALRDKLFKVFFDEIDAALKLEHELDAAYKQEQIKREQKWKVDSGKSTLTSPKKA